jgi:hypothetical protein
MTTIPVDGLLASLEKVKQSGLGQWRARCPAHDSKGLTLSIAEADSGAALVHCFAGCEPAAILAAVGLELSDLYPRENVLELRRHDRRPRKDLHGQLHHLCHAATVVLVAAEHIEQGKTMSEADLGDLHVACRAIRRALQ